MKKKPLLPIAAALCCLFTVINSALAQGTAFTYQGRLTEGGEAANGNYELRFTVFDALTGGAPVGLPVTNAPTAVSNGLFAVNLNFGAGIFMGSARWLEVGVRTNGSVGAYTTNSPRQALTPAPYALFAATAGGVTNGAITSTMLAGGAVTSSKLANGAVTGQQLADSISLGTNLVGGELDVYSTQAGTPSIKLVGANSQISTYYNANAAVAAQLSASAFGSLLNLFNSNGFVRAQLSGGNGGIAGSGSLDLYDASSANTVNLTSTGNSWLTGGSFGIGTTSPVRQLHVRAAQAIGRFETTSSGNGSVLELQNSGPANSLGAINFLDGLGNVPVQLTGFTNGDMAFRAGALERARITALGVTTVFTPSGANGIVLDPLNKSVSAYDGIGHELGRLSGDTWGELLLNNSSASHPTSVDLSANGIQGGLLSLNAADGSGRARLSGANAGGELSLYTSGGARNVYLTGNNGTTGVGGLIDVKNNSGVSTIELIGDTGSGFGQITTSVLQITGGADLSEQFDVRTLDGNLLPGMVVCIDAAHPGQLAVSTKAYDRAVAGIVSGAGGVNPGMLMGHQGTAADGKHPIALTGRVYCLADASGGPIEPGDLLTTSATPGHAMKVTEAARAQGAILGKAMGSLERGKGLVLVLVTLQ